MFGVLPDYLSLMGFTAAKTKGPFTEELLNRTDILFVINSYYRWTPEELQRIYRWVESGGALCILGDHTDLGGMMKSLNPLLSMFGGKLNFETGDMFRPILKHGWRTSYHPILLGIKSYPQIYWGTGGTLTTSLPFVPLIEGAYTFGDEGNYSANSYFGNRTYDTGENAGDITLAAIAEVGKGKVLACADTSPFLNGTIHLSFYPFLYHLFKWLQIRSSIANPMYIRCISALLLVIVLLYLWRSHKRESLIIGIVGVILGLFICRSINTQAFQPVQKNRSLTILDLSHLSKWATDPFKTHSLDGSAGVFLRTGFLPITTWQFESSILEHTKIFVIQEPAITYSAHEKEMLFDWVKNGGVLVVAGSYENSSAVNDLLSPLHLRIGNVPLGSAYKKMDSLGQNVYAHIPNTAPIMYTEISKALTVQYTTEVLLENEGYPVAVRTKFGRGKVIIVASDRFLTSQVFQDKENTNRSANVLWFMNILTETMSGIAK